MRNATDSNQSEALEDKIWDILNLIEIWQRNQENSDNPQFQSLISEVKSTLLPLIPPALSRNNEGLSSVNDEVSRAFI
jgi:hypothetical protein